ncbi:endo-1,4-beta-xylanase [Lacihabitans sp. CS3-21]|uniref:endo-1,4-beta-xylanase n=1 Tax=Lacihabitans sp. CS3-21 TaxID=2487332 RepID=UPI0020CE2805|nr:endo-1,4-beta-xylanase [Lacihabitans sp. CS3-21]MCP9747064.1 endo-1,4-beta-xylanase [Lacihabitans sp. CS3-21]
MKPSNFKYQLLFICSIGLFSATFAQNQPTSLKEAFKNDFLVGTALGAEHILEKDAKANQLIKKEFNAITPENHMKSMNIHPEWNKYDFYLGDKFVEYGQKNNMYVVGHTLVWHSQLPRFVGKIKSADSLKLFMTDHINTVAGRYAGKINSWDVVNEAIEDDGTFRKSIFYNLLGEDFIKMAFDLAAKADPKAELYYNDYNNEQPAKRKATIEMIKKLKASGTKIDGVGIQGHWSINSLNTKNIEDAIIEYAALGLKVAFTELDLTVLPNPWDLKGADVNQNFENSPKMNPYPKELPDSVQTTLAQKYEELFKVFLKHQDKIDRITFWGVADNHSWLNGWPVRGRTNYPLLFDRNFEPKKAYNSVMNLKKNNPNL